MVRYETLAELKAAYDSGELSKLKYKVWLDNDDASILAEDDITTDGDTDTHIFEVHPEDLLEQALDLLGVPWEHV